jgi:superfamily I DNA and/or RNA helicase/very-short-patch-repair endonuclease
MWNKLANDLEKKRRVLPVRKLVEKYSEIIFKIAPCWLASPEAVASVFPLKRNLFDFIIFDEASQSAVERSLTSLYRGHHVVVMGDEKQLRPFDLFRMQDDDEEEADEELIDESLLSESLLVLAKRTYGCRYLVWHYRSKYQELINFSNHAFYDGHLQVAPNTIRTPKLPPIHWVKCENGLWANRENLREAYAVVNVIENLLIQDEDEDFRSIGVITFNDTQRTAILDEIDRRRKSDPTFDELYTAAENPQSKNLDDIPFVKNIENVQGDERDIIIFSVGYAKDVEGKLRLRFGTLNQEGGENRLNVAISRARQEIIVVSSIEPDELRTDTAKNNGPRRFKDYLRYAKFISEGRNDDVKNILENLNPGFTRNVNLSGKSGDNTVIFESTFEEIVYDRLLNLGYEVVTQVGYSGYRIDLAIVHPDEPSKYILGIECDGAMFHSARSTRERDVMRQEFLQSRGWIIERIWSTNWWRNPQKEIERIRQRVEAIRSQIGVAIMKE